MGNIHLLDELTINKIAAGEVIERPASVIKEMVENSIDAGANNITIEIKNGGISFIRITDNGKGIAQDDLEMAFERHATSKIRSAEDLDTVASMGFRGEALASIAAIANVELISKTEEQQSGYKVVVESGKVLNKEETGCQTGTTITVKNLFFNTPVRYKFLKKDYTETGYIEDVVTRIALVNPQISFKLINTGKTILQTSGNGNIKDAIYSIYGRDVAEGILNVDYTFDDIKITGVIGKPEIARSNRSNQLFFVNKRYVKDKVLTAATEQAYKGMIDAGKFGFAVLNLEMPQTKVDVNVHPAKLEVRFAQESNVFQAVFHAIKDTLLKDYSSRENSTPVDNIIIQTREPENTNDLIDSDLNEQSENIDNNLESDSKTENNDKPRGLGFFSWKRNKNLFGEPSNIVEDLYNQKKENEYSAIYNNENNTQMEEENKQDDIVNTSDVLKELKQLNEHVQNEINENKTQEDKAEEITDNNNNLPDGKTYTYVGENKEKIEDLLRQLHPETYNRTEQETTETVVETPVENTESSAKVADEEISYEHDKDVETEQEKDIAEQEVKAELVTEVEPNLEATQKIEKALIEDNQETQKFNLSENTYNNYASSNFNQMYEKLFGTPVKDEEDEEKAKEEKDLNAVDIIKDNVSVFEGMPTFEKPTYKIIGDVFGEFIIVEIEKEMYIINKNTAKEKVIFEQLKSNYYNKVNKESQMLLLPDIIELTNKQTEIINENLNLLLQAGFSFEEFGENTLRLMGVPMGCMELDTKDLFIKVLENINTVPITAIQEKEEKIVGTIAHEISNISKEVETLEEINSLMDDLLQCKDPFTLDIEKPIAIKMSKYDIERKFSRK